MTCSHRMQVALILGMSAAISAIAIAQITTLTPVQSPAGLSARGLAIADFTGSGVADIATIVDAPERVQFLVHSKGPFYTPGPSVLLPDGSDAQDLVTADFYNNGLPDLAVAVRQPAGAVHFYKHTGKGAVMFSSQIVETGASPRGFSVGDLNNNGWLDAVVANSESNTATVLFNKAGFFAPLTFPTVGEPRDTALGDLNNNGHLDLAVSDRTNRVVRTYAGGSWTPAQTLPLPDQVWPEGVVAADLTNNGWADLAVAANFTSKAAGQVHVFHNINSKFAPPAKYANIGLGAARIVAADLDCDGWVDLAVTNAQSKSMTILHNSFGSFPNQMNVATGARGAIAAADLNDNGRVDLVTANGDSNSVTVVLNTSEGCAPPSPCGPPGDLNCDGSIGVPDLLILLANWGPCADPDNCPADLTGSGSVGVPDLLVLLNNWG